MFYHLVLEKAEELAFYFIALFEFHPVFAQNLVDALVSIIRCKQCGSL